MNKVARVSGVRGQRRERTMMMIRQGVKRGDRGGDENDPEMKIKHL